MTSKTKQSLETINTPSDWKLLKLEEISQEIYRYPTYYNIEYVENGIPEVRGELINDNGTLEIEQKKYRLISPSTSSKFSRTILKEGDFVLSVRGTIGKVGIVPKNLEGANITANLIRISPVHSIIFPLFLKYQFLSQSFQETLNNLSPQTTIKTIQAPLLKGIKIFIPPLKEQQKIASILSNVDELIEKTEQIIEQTQRLKKGLINKLIIQGLDIRKNVYQKIPENHQYIKLSEIITINPSYRLEKDKEYKFVEMAAINENTKSINYCIRRKPSSGYAIFKNNDILFARITPCTENGKICLVRDISGYGLGSTELIVLGPGYQILPQFLCYYCQTDKVRNHAISQMGGATGRQRVPYKVFTEDLFILLPPKEIQQKIVNCIESIEKIITLKSLEKEKIVILKKGLMQQLLTGKIRVKFNK